MALGTQEYNGKYLDGDGLELVWSKIKNKFAESGHTHEDLTFGSGDDPKTYNGSEEVNVLLSDLTDFHHTYDSNWYTAFTNHDFRSADLKYRKMLCDISAKTLLYYDSSYYTPTKSGSELPLRARYSKTEKTESDVYVPFVGFTSAKGLGKVRVDITINGNTYDTYVSISYDTPVNWTFCFVKSCPFEIVVKSDTNASTQMWSFLKIPASFTGTIEYIPEHYYNHPYRFFTFTETLVNMCPEVNNAGSFPALDELPGVATLPSYFYDREVGSTDSCGSLDVDFFVNSPDELHIEYGKCPDWIVNDFILHNLQLKMILSDIYTESIDVDIQSVKDIGDELGDNAAQNLIILNRYISEKRELNFKGKKFRIKFDGLIDVDYCLVIRNGYLEMSTSSRSIQAGFRALDGFSLEIYDMTIEEWTTGNSRLVVNESLDFYIDRIIISNSRFINLTRAFRLIGATDAWEDPTFGIGSVKMTDSSWIWDDVQPGNGLKLDNIPVFNECLFANNHMTNCCVGFSMAVTNGTEGKALSIAERSCPVIIKGNYFDCGVLYNDDSSNYSTYHSSVLIETGTVYFEDNTIERCVTITSLSVETTAYDMYSSSLEVYGNNNVIKNVMGWGVNGGLKPLTEVFKSKMSPAAGGTRKVVRKYTNNVVVVDSEYMSSLGLDLSSSENCTLVMAMNEGYNFSDITLENNVFDMPNTQIGHAFRSAKRISIQGNRFNMIGNDTTYGVIDINGGGISDFVCESLRITGNEIRLNGKPIYVATIGCVTNDVIITDNVLEGVKGSLLRPLTRSTHKVMGNLIASGNKMVKCVGQKVDSNDVKTECSGSVRYSKQMNYENASSTAGFSVNPQNNDYCVTFYTTSQNNIDARSRMIRLNFDNSVSTEYTLTTRYVSERHPGSFNAHVLRIKGYGSDIKYYDYDSESWVNFVDGTTKVYIDNNGKAVSQRVYWERIGNQLVFTQNSGATTLMNNKPLSVSVEVVELNGADPVTEPSLVDYDGNELIDSNGLILTI